MSKNNEPFDEAIVPDEDNHNNTSNGDDEGVTDTHIENKKTKSAAPIPESKPLKPQPQFQPPASKKTFSEKLGIALGGISLSASIIAIFFALNAANSTSSLRDDVNTAFQSVDGSIESFGDVRTQLEVDVQTLKESFISTEKKLY